MKWIFFLLMLAIFFNLFKGLFHLLQDGGTDSRGVVRSLTIRVALTVCFFAGLYAADHFGLIEGHSLRGGIESSAQGQDSSASQSPARMDSVKPLAPVNPSANL